MIKKIIPIIILGSIIMGTLFYFSNISFQLESFNWKLWAVEVLYMLTIGALGGFVVYRHTKRNEKNN